jgi:hypothetical protein
MKLTAPRVLGVLAVALTVAACSSEGPTSAAVLASRSIDLTANEGESDVTVCKFGPLGSTATFSISATAGSLLHSNVTINAHPIDPGAACVLVWRSGVAGLTGSVTVTETAMSEGVELQMIRVWSNQGYAEYFPPTSSVTVGVTSTEGALIYFKNKESVTPPPPPPPPALAGCTPGYWKQSQHFDSWTMPYTPGTSFGSVFADAFPGKTLLQVVALGGGGLNALGRHTVAALLNAASSGVESGMTTAQVIAAFNAAYASGSYETQKNVFEAMNEIGCPLN